MDWWRNERARGVVEEEPVQERGREVTTILDIISEGTARLLLGNSVDILSLSCAMLWPLLVLSHVLLVTSRPYSPAIGQVVDDVTWNNLLQQQWMENPSSERETENPDPPGEIGAWLVSGRRAVRLSEANMWITNRLKVRDVSNKEGVIRPAVNSRATRPNKTSSPYIRFPPLFPSTPQPISGSFYSLAHTRAQERDFSEEAGFGRVGALASIHNESEQPCRALRPSSPHGASSARDGLRFCRDQRHLAAARTTTEVGPALTVVHTSSLLYRESPNCRVGDQAVTLVEELGHSHAVISQYGPDTFLKNQLAALYSGTFLKNQLAAFYSGTFLKNQLAPFYSGKILKNLLTASVT
uniref:Uncharacterized protein n=1 Tax=Timema genevievae TaxID=629358 RepID=A0A7R9JY94_TIMGE|nr:unnamed protein product [Timema genevievae]